MSVDPRVLDLLDNLSSAYSKDVTESQLQAQRSLTSAQHIESTCILH